jgi:hypothetical protein
MKRSRQFGPEITADAILAVNLHPDLSAQSI